ncbi:MAG: xanthine dehydrogenase accessory factor [Fusobacteria bacterium]|nr:MAG: xanthine dehydrogenase accessory factor [Fusobacteriota bacterium]KAF0228518.1 MAG: xanthine dehydrogenase accessory [Fusobacteriota bacterium]
MKKEYKRLILELESGRKAVIVTRLVDFFKKELVLEEDFDTNEIVVGSDVLESGNPMMVEEKYLLEPYFPAPKLVIFGGGHIAKPLSLYASRAGFGVTVIDDRPSFANAARFPDAERVICESFGKSFGMVNFNRSVFVAIITRGHRHDMDCLKAVLKHETAYVGMIGSRRRVRNTKEQLLIEGYSQDVIDRLMAPIGLDIGAVTPDEIAFSIVAQLIQQRRRGMSKKTNWPEFDLEVLKELSMNDSSPKALVTIIGTKGSVPRKAGAKMLVYSDGRISGSIGGGCSEGEVIVNARKILKNGGYMVQRVDMTGDIAEEEGMACGGIMDVLIEPLISL